MELSFFKRYENGDRALGSRLSTFKIALSLLDHTKNNNFIETGTTRKNYLTTPDVCERAADGGSTLIFADYVSRFGGHVWTCDIEKKNIENCKIATEQYQKSITYVVDDSLNFLNNFNQKIDFLYLDSVDSHLPNANEHQLKEIKLAYKNLHNKSIILLDDLGSKTNLSIPFLKDKNWCQILIDVPRPARYNNLMQGIFVKEEFLYIDHSSIPEDKRFKDV
jgi:hypothetical protein